MQKTMSKKKWKLCQGAPKMMPKWMPKSMKNLCDFGTCDFSVFAESITLKLFFYMKNDAKHYEQSIKNRCQNEVGKKDAKMMEKGAKRELKWSPAWAQNDPKCGPSRPPKVPPKLKNHCNSVYFRSKRVPEGVHFSPRNDIQTAIDSDTLLCEKDSRSFITLGL